MKRVIVHVEGLVLHGFGHGDRREIAAGLESALSRLLAEPGAARALAGRGDADRVQAGRVRIASERGAAGTGRAVGGKIVRAIAT